MKFEYDNPRGEPVAYIDCEGDLIIRDRPSGARNACLCRDGDVFGGVVFTPDDPTNRRVFYPGDRITITF